MHGVVEVEPAARVGAAGAGDRAAVALRHAVSNTIDTTLLTQQHIFTHVAVSLCEHAVRRNTPTCVSILCDCLVPMYFQAHYLLSTCIVRRGIASDDENLPSSMSARLPSNISRVPLGGDVMRQLVAGRVVERVRASERASRVPAHARARATRAVRRPAANLHTQHSAQ